MEPTTPIPPAMPVPPLEAGACPRARAGLLPWLALLGAMALFGGSFVALKDAFRFYDPYVVIFGRMLVAALAFSLLLPRMNVRSVRRRDVKWLALMTLCEPCLYFVFEGAALEYTTASQAGIVVALLPLLVGVGAAAVLKERLTWRFICGCIVALAGVAALSLQADARADAPNPLLGNFLEFMAMVCAMGYTITAKALLSRYKPVLIASMQGLGGTLFFLPMLFLPGTELPTEFHLQGVVGIVFLGLGVTFGAFLLYVWSLQYVAAGKASLASNLVPVFAVLSGWFFLGETLNRWQLLAVPVVVAGVLISQVEERKAVFAEETSNVER